MGAAGSAMSVAPALILLFLSGLRALSEREGLGLSGAHRAWLVVAVPSPVHEAQRRHHQRRQWQRSLGLLAARAVPGPPPATVWRFLLGTQRLRPGHSVGEVEGEAGAYGDLLLLDAPDYDGPAWREELGPYDASATTVKVLVGLKWAARHYDFEYFLRLGDDAYFRPERLWRLHAVGALPRNMSALGKQLWTHGAFRTQAGLVDLPFLAGSGFVLTPDVVRHLARLPPDMLLLGPPEDVVVFSWLVGTPVRLIDQPGFRLVWEPCEDPEEDLLVHYVKGEELWGSISEEGLLSCGGPD